MNQKPVQDRINARIKGLTLYTEKYPENETVVVLNRCVIEELRWFLELIANQIALEAVGQGRVGTPLMGDDQLTTDIEAFLSDALNSRPAPGAVQ